MDISLNFDSLDKMIITSSDSKVNFGKIKKEVDCLSVFQGQNKAKEIQNSRYAIVNVSKKDLSNNMRDFEILPYESYERKRPKHKPTNSYFYLSRYLTKCMMRDDALSLHVYPVIKEINGKQHIPTSQVYSRDESKLNEFLVEKLYHRSYLPVRRTFQII